MNKSDKKDFLQKALGIFFWLVLWQAAAMALGKSIILVTPAAAVKRLFGICFDADFLKTVLNSFLRIGGGFFAGVFTGTALAVLSAAFSWARAVISPAVSAVKAVPVASFIIFALFFLKSSALSLLISAMMVTPVIYDAVCKGIENTDNRLIEAALLFRLSPAKKARYLYFPSVMPFLTAAFRTAAGLAFKSGTAAEVIGQPDFTMGDMLYRSKIYLETADLFAWTIVIIILGKLFEVLVISLLDVIYRRSRRFNIIRKFKGGVCSDD
ncbi:MAG: ABC transporter permease subunit [Oscillospiraceae bacterium]|nr:ABC transporter permease subunit [Oscillospiraceae bacterium]